MTIDVRVGSVGLEGGAFMYIFASNHAKPREASSEEVLRVAEDKVKELGVIQVAQTRDYIHDNMFKVAILVVSPQSKKLAFEQMQRELHMGPGPFPGC